MSLKEIMERLANDHSIVCTNRMIEQRFKIWGIRRRPRALETAALCLKITTMFYINFPNPSIVRALN
jgi:hypothetical protein